VGGVPYYDADGVTIYHGDCREIMRSLAWDVTVTDPPYPGREDLFATDAIWDALAFAVACGPALIFWPCVAPYPVREPGAAHVWWKSVPIHPRSKTGNVAGHQYERILAYKLGAKCKVYREAAIMPGFAACAEECEEHPTQKPLALMRQLIGDTKGEVVLDPFAGTGTTLIAAREAGRRAIGIELDERYCEIAARRLAQGFLPLGGGGAELVAKDSCDSPKSPNESILMQ